MPFDGRFNDLENDLPVFTQLRSVPWLVNGSIEARESGQWVSDP